MTINISGGEISEKELSSYIERGEKKFGRNLVGIYICLKNDEVDIYYHLEGEPHERIERRK